MNATSFTVTPQSAMWRYPRRIRGNHGKGVRGLQSSSWHRLSNAGADAPRKLRAVHARLHASAGPAYATIFASARSGKDNKDAISARELAVSKQNQNTLPHAMTRVPRNVNAQVCMFHRTDCHMHMWRINIGGINKDQQKILIYLLFTIHGWRHLDDLMLHQQNNHVVNGRCESACSVFADPCVACVV